MVPIAIVDASDGARRVLSTMVSIFTGRRADHDESSSIVARVCRMVRVWPSRLGYVEWSCTTRVDSIVSL